MTKVFWHRKCQHSGDADVRGRLNHHEDLLLVGVGNEGVFVRRGRDWPRFAAAAAAAANVSVDFGVPEIDVIMREESHSQYQFAAAQKMSGRVKRKRQCVINQVLIWSMIGAFLLFSSGSPQI